MLLRLHSKPGRWLRTFTALAMLWITYQYFKNSSLFSGVHHAVLDTDLINTDVIARLNSPDSSSVLSSHFAREFCNKHGYGLYIPPHPEQRRKVYDLLLINTELDWLEIRLATLAAHVDYFVIVEASKTFTGMDKPLHIKQNWDRFKEWHEQIIYHQLVFPEHWDPQRTWDNEDLQRDATYTQVLPTLTGVQAPNPGDVLIVADVDEIPRPATIAILRACDFPKRLTLHSRFYYYSFEFLHRGQEWAHPQATYYTSSPATIKPTNLRNGDGGLQPLIALDKGDLWNAAWHCSSCFSSINELLTKMASFSHTGLNGEQYRDKDRIADHVRNGKDLWDREGEDYNRVEGNTDVPEPLLRDRKRWSYLLHRSGESAGFSDYP